MIRKAKPGERVMVESPGGLRRFEGRVLVDDWPADCLTGTVVRSWGTHYPKVTDYVEVKPDVGLGTRNFRPSELTRLRPGVMVKLDIEAKE